MWPGKWISHSPGTNGQVASVRLNMTDAVTRVQQDSQFSSHWRCVLFGSLCPAADQVAYYPNPAKVSLWHWHKHYTPHTPVWLKIAVAHEDVRMVERQKKWLQGTTTAQRHLDKRDLSTFCSSKPHACFCWHGWVTMCVMTSRRLAKGADCQEVAGCD